MKKYLTENTLKITWVNSGVTPSTIVGAVYDGNEVLVDSGSMVSSGNGHYYRLFDVTTPGFYIAETRATISSNPYRNAVLFKAILKQAD